MKTLIDLTTLDSLYYFLKHSIRSLQAIHARGESHGAIQPCTLSIDLPYECLEDSVDTIYSAPEVALGLAVVEKYKPEEAVQIWKQESIAIRWIEHWIPSVAEEYTSRALQKLIGTPIPEQQSDIWSLGISYLSVYDSLSKEESFPEKELFFEAL
jgi:serine/threonine protein kinase